MSRPQAHSKWEHLNDIKLPEISGEDITLLIGANFPEAQIHEEVRVGGAEESNAVRQSAKTAGHAQYVSRAHRHQVPPFHFQNGGRRIKK